MDDIKHELRLLITLEELSAKRRLQCAELLEQIQQVEALVNQADVLVRIIDKDIKEIRKGL